MNKAMEAYTQLKDLLGEEEKITPIITKRECIENGWTYTFFFCRGELKKVEAYNHREIIEVWND